MILLAMDRAPGNRSARTFDENGRMLVESTHISKANICPYFGREIPDYEALGLEPDRIYRLLRHPDELAAGAHTFNKIPLLLIHKASFADNHPREVTVGTTGESALFVAPYLDNSLSVWDQEAIDLIESNRQRELSSSYKYRADMTAGIFEGLPFDGIMRNIIGNHVALVVEGRAGPDVLVSDSRLEISSMLKSRKALMTSGAVLALVRPALAADATLDMDALFQGVTANNLADQRDDIAARIFGTVQPHLAADSKLDMDAIGIVIDTMAGIAMDGADEIDDMADDAGMTDEEKAERDKKRAEDAVEAAKSALPAPKNVTILKPAEKVGGGAMDGAPVIDEAKLRAEITASLHTDLQAVRLAEREVQPFIGALDSVPDSADKIYRLALDHAKVEHKHISDVGALRTMVGMLGASHGDRPTIAADAAIASEGFRERFSDLPTVRNL